MAYVSVSMHGARRERTIRRPAATLAFLTFILPLLFLNASLASCAKSANDEISINFYVSMADTTEDVGTIFTIVDENGHPYLYLGFDNGTQTGIQLNNRVLVLSIAERTEPRIEDLGKPFRSNYVYLNIVENRLVAFDRTGKEKPKYYVKNKGNGCEWRPAESLPGDGRIALDADWSKHFSDEDEYVYGAISSNGRRYIFFNSGNWYQIDHSGKPRRIFDNALTNSANQVYCTKKSYAWKLLGQYPSGNLFSLEGPVVKSFSPKVPSMPPTPDVDRELQSLAVYGGNIFVGVWPWGEVWEYDVKQSKWSLFRRFFSGPAYDANLSPFQEAVKKEFGDRIMANEWGQRISSLITYDDGLFVATANKCNEPTCPDFMPAALCKEYGHVWKISMFPQQTFEAPRQSDFYLKITIAPDAIDVYQNQEKLGSLPITSEIYDKIKKGRERGIKKGEGPLGAFEGENLLYFRDNELGYF